MHTKTLVLLSILGAAWALAPGAALPDVPVKTSEAAAPETNADAFAEYTVGVFLLESGSAQAAIPHLVAAWERSSHDETIGSKLADAYFETGDMANCEKIVDALLAQREDNHVALLLKAKIAYLTSRKDEARGYLEKLEAAGGSSFEVQRILAAVYTELGMTDKALAAYAAAVKMEPEHPLVQYQYGTLLRESGRAAEAEEALSQALRVKPDFSEAAIELAEIIVERGGHAEAESVLVRSLAADPENDRALEIVTDLYIDQGQPDKAIRLLEQQNRRSPLSNEGLLLLGRLYYEVKDYEEALNIFEGMFEAGNATPDLARVLGEISSRAGKTDKALRYYREAIRLGPGDFRNHLALFFSASSTFTPEESQRVRVSAEESGRCLTEAARVVPSSDFDGLYLVGISMQSVDSLETALEFLSRASEIRAGDERVILNLASVLEKLKRYEEAERHVATLHALQPDDPTTCNFYGYLLALMGKDLDRAEELIGKALASEPQNGYYMDSLGWVFFMRGDYPRAIEELEKAAAVTRDDPVILEHLGDAYRAVERYREALDAYEKSKDLEKKNGDIERKIDETKKKRRGK
ncbi:MAG: Tetratricopeptide 1 repeat-containing protein [Candidatus Krumholzibacteriota bacterium]|nr:Tetratricopeptide 1 repeat-containing protein [Candidatus Krumholzibacteriota bacterium]